MTQVVTSTQVREETAAPSVDADKGMGEPQGSAGKAAHAGMANLIPFAKGHDPRRANGRNSGASYIEWCNRLDVYSTPELRAISKAPNGQGNPQSRARAAETILRSRKPGFAKNGAPFAGHDTDRILDRTVGRPKQHVEVVQQEVKDPRAQTLDLLHLLAEHPELRQYLSNEVAGLLPQAEAPQDPPGAPKEDAGEG